MLIVVAGVACTLALLGQVAYFAHKAKYSRMRDMYSRLAVFALLMTCIVIIIFCFIYASQT